MGRLPLHRDGKAGIGRHFESLSCGVAKNLFRTIEHNLTVTRDDLHSLGLPSSEVIASGKDHPNGLVIALLGDDGVGDDPALEVNIGLGVNGGVGEFHGM